MNSEKQQQIKSQAMEIISKEGMGALTISNLSRHIGVSDGAIYRHFDSKLSIIKEILNDLFFLVSDQMVDEVNRKVHVKDKLKYVIGKLYHIFEVQPAYVSLLFSEEYFVSNDELFYTMHTIVNTMQLYLKQIIEEGIAHKELTKGVDSTQMSLLIMGSMRITVLNWRLKRYSGNLYESGEKLLDSILKLMKV